MTADLAVGERQEWTFEGVYGGVVSVSMDGFDTFLRLYGPSGDLVIENDDYNGLNSYLSVGLCETGTYTISAGSYADSGEGPYELSLNGGDGDLGGCSGSTPTVPEGEPEDWDGSTTSWMDESTTTTSWMDEPTTSWMEQDGTTTSWMEQDGTTTSWMEQDGTTTSWMDEPVATTAEPSGGSISAGETMTADLAVGERQEWTFEGVYGGVVSVSMDGFDTFLRLYGPSGDLVLENDDYNGLNSYLSVGLCETGTYTISAGSYADSGEGPYELSLGGGDVDLGGCGTSLETPSTSWGQDESTTSWMGQDGSTTSWMEQDGSTTSWQDAGSTTTPAAGGPDGSISAGGAVTGWLSRGERQQWTFEGVYGGVASVSMDGFDTYLRLYGPRGDEVAFNDDYNGLNSYLSVGLCETGTYTISAGSYADSGEGTYELSLGGGDVDLGGCGTSLESPSSLPDGGLPGGPNEPGPIPGEEGYEPTQPSMPREEFDEPEDWDGSTTTWQDLSATGGPIVSGEVAAGWLPFGERQEWTFEGVSGGVASVSMNGFDTYLRLYSPSGSLVTENDDSNGLNSYFSVGLCQTGTYTISAGSYADSGEGTYELSLNGGEIDLGGCGTMVDTPSTTWLMPTASLSGASVVRDEATGCETTTYADGTEYGQCDDGTNWSDGMDGYWSRTDIDPVTGCSITTSNEGGESGYCEEEGGYRNWWDDGAGYRSETEYDAATGCTTTFENGLEVETWCNDYRSTPSMVTTTWMPADLGGEAGGGLISSGASVSEWLSVGQRHDWTFEGVSGGVAMVEMSGFDTYLRLYGPAGMLVAENDDHNGLNSYLEFGLCQTGTYTISAGSYADSGEGAYDLSLGGGDVDADGCGGVGLMSGEPGMMPEWQDEWDQQWDAGPSSSGDLGETFRDEETGCEVTTYGDGTETGSCDDGTHWWNGLDGYWSRTDIDPSTGCSVTTGSDGSEAGWCEGEGDAYSSWWEDDSGRRNETFYDPVTGCSTTIGGDGSEDSWCESSYAIATTTFANVATIGSLVPDQTVVADLGRGDRHEWTFEGLDGGVIAVAMSGFDTYLRLYGPTGSLIAENDDFEGLSSRIEVGLCATGTYSVSAGSYSDSGEGTYELWFAGGDVDRDGCQASELFEEMSSDGACSTSIGYDGSESGWCDDGSRWYVGADGSGYRTLIDQETGCEVTTNTDGSESGWCGDIDGQGSTQSWWTDEQGNRSEDYWEATTGCSTSTYSDGSTYAWCEDGSGSSTDAHGRSETWTQTRDEERGCSTTSYDNGRSDTWCEDGSGSWTDENGRTESWIETRDETAGCTSSVYDDGRINTWCDDGAGSYTDEFGNSSITYRDDSLGCTTTVNSDGSSNSWCDDGSGSWTDVNGRTDSWTETWDDATGCRTSLHSNGSSDSWCENGSGFRTEENGRTETWVETWDPVAECTTTSYSDGSANTWCEDGSNSWVDGYGNSSTTGYDSLSGCTTELRSDDSASTWCDDGSSTWTDTSGRVSQTLHDQTTGCSTTTEWDGSESVWCDDGSGSWTDADGRTESWTTVFDQASGCTIEAHSTGGENTWCEDGSGSWMDASGETVSWTPAAYDADTGCTTESRSDGSVNSWCDDGSNTWSSEDGTTTVWDPKKECSTTGYQDGSENVWCDDGSGSWTDADGTSETWTTSYKADTGCTVELRSDGSSQSWCDDGSSSWTDDDGAIHRSFYDEATGCQVETGTDGSISTWCDDGSGSWTSPEGVTEHWDAPVTTYDDETGCTVEQYDDGSSFEWCPDGRTVWTGSDGQTDEWLPPVQEIDSDGTVTTRWVDGSTETSYLDGSSKTAWADGSWEEVTVRPDGTVVTMWSEGSSLVEFPDGREQYTDPWGNASTTVSVGSGTDSVKVTSYENGSTLTRHDDGSEVWADAGGYVNETTVDPLTGARITTESDGTLLIDRPDGSFEYHYPDGSVDEGSVDEFGNLVIRYANGATSVAYADGEKRHTDEWGVTAQTSVGEDGSTYTVFSDGWTEQEAEDGSWSVRTGPTGEAVTTRTLSDGTKLTEHPGGATERYEPGNRLTTYTSAAGEVYLTREEEDGTIVTVDPDGTISQYNPMTGATIVVGNTGDLQESVRSPDGDFEITLEDGTAIVQQPDGSQTVTAPDGAVDTTTSTENGSVTENADGTRATRTKDDAGDLTVEFEYPDGVGGAAKVVASPSDGTIEIELADGELVEMEVDVDGTITVEDAGGLRIYDPAKGVAASVSTKIADDGSRVVTGSTGATSTISADGTKMTVESADGTTALATKTENGVTVEIDGVTYTYAFGGGKPAVAEAADASAVGGAELG